MPFIDRLAESLVARAARSRTCRQLQGVQRGPGGRVGPGATIIAAHGLWIGTNVWIGAGFYCHADGGVTIGDNTHISRDCTIYSSKHRTEGRRLPYDEERVMRPVVVSPNVRIGKGVSIVPGTRIGEGAIIGMGSVVHGTVEAFAIVGAASQVIGQRNVSHYERLKRDQAFGGADGRPLRESEH